MEKKTIKRVLEENLYLDGYLDSVIEMLQDLKNKYKDEYQTLSIEIYRVNKFGDDITETELHGTRKETDEEYIDRLKLEEEIKEKQQKSDINILQRLIKQYGIPKYTKEEDK